MATVHDPALYQLRHALRGHVYDPGEPEYEDACTLFNAIVDTRPRHVVRVSHPHQVSAALAFARARDMRVAVRGGGHSVAGASLVDDGLVIDVRGLRELVVDPERRVVRAGGGLTWGEVDAATQEHVMVEAPDELSLAFLFLTDDDGRPAVAVAGMYAGRLPDADAALAPTRAAGPALDAFAPTPYAAFQAWLDDPPGYRNWWTAEYLADLGAGAIDAICALAEELPAGPAQIFIPAWGGAVARGTAGPLTGRGARFVVHPLLMWEDPAEDARMVAHGRRWREALAPYRTGASYPNFAGDEGHDRVRAAYGPHYERLASVKAGWDPNNVFRATGNPRATD